MKNKRKRRTPKILTGNNRALKVVCVPVVFYRYNGVKTADGIEEVIRDMLYCLTKRNHGVGLAANQIGSNLRIIIVKTSPTQYQTMINPVIENNSIKTNIAPEGCLSYPGVTKRISRYNSIIVRFNNESGQEMRVEFKDFSARIIQHEIDHLDGFCKIGETNE